MPYRCQVCTKTLTAGAYACSACGLRFHQSVPAGEAPAGPFLAWPQPMAKSGFNWREIGIGVLVVLGVIIACFLVAINSQSTPKTADSPDPQKQAAYAKATENLGNLLVRQDARVSHVTASYTDAKDTATTSMLTVTVQGDLTPYTTRQMAQYYYQAFTAIRYRYFDPAKAADCDVFVADDTGKDLAHADNLGVSN